MPKHQQSDKPEQSLVVQPTHSPQESTFADKALTVAAVGVAAALIEVELIPGMLLGVGAMLMPNLLPKLGSGLRPLVKGVISAGYGVASKTRETVAEAGEQIQDMVAEVKAEKNLHPSVDGPVESPRSSTTA